MKKIKKYFLTFGASISTFAIPVLAMSCKSKEDTELDKIKKDLDSLVNQLGEAGSIFKSQIDAAWKNVGKMSKEEKETLIKKFKKAKERMKNLLPNSN